MPRSRFFVFIVILMITFNSFATVYQCPKTPINISLGETIQGNWFVWTLGEKQTFFKKYYYKYFEKKYMFKYWFSFPSGIRVGEQSKKNKFIACCGWLQKEKKYLCI